MARPTRTRQIPEHLEGRIFKPRGQALPALDRRTLTLDALEALRLADHLGLYQEEAARRMGVSRATFARILGEARRVVAGALVEGRALEIAGGVVERRARTLWPCPVHGRGGRRGRGCHCRRGRRGSGDDPRKGR